MFATLTNIVSIALVFAIDWKNIFSIQNSFFIIVLFGFNIIFVLKLLSIIFAN